MLASEREKIILEYLTSHEIATTKFLCELTGASIATIRRDLNFMEKQGLLKKNSRRSAKYCPKILSRLP